MPSAANQRSLGNEFFLEGSAHEMLALRYLLIVIGIGLFGSAGALVAYDVFLSSQLNRLLRRWTSAKEGEETAPLPPRPFVRARWGLAQRLAAAAGAPILPARADSVVAGRGAGGRGV